MAPPAFGVANPTLNGPAFPTPLFGPDARFADVIVNLQEAPTGRLMIGAAVNSDAGVTGQIVIDERNFDWRQVPTSWDDVLAGRAFRGGGQTFRLEALPGSQFERYQASFTEPFFLNTRVSLDLSAYLFERSYFDWNEGRIGGRVGLGYRITPDLSISGQLRGEEVEISEPRIPGVAELDAVLGKHDVYGGRVSLAHDTRDLPFAPTQGHYLELSYEQVFGSFDYPRGMIDWRRYFLVLERPDGSGRHVLGFSNRFGITGGQTPIFDNFFAGGYSTMRGFNLRGASPRDSGVIVGGELLTLGSVEYIFPITADDMLRGVFFVDYGTVEEDVKIEAEDYRVALGAGLRINIPAMGPAPIAIDFAVPVAREDTDDIQNISFFFGLSR
jgi:outer membrane protein insertion porin family